MHIKNKNVAFKQGRIFERKSHIVKATASTRTMPFLQSKVSKLYSPKGGIIIQIAFHCAHFFFSFLSPFYKVGFITGTSTNWSDN